VPFLCKAAQRINIVGQLFSYLMSNKRWWMTPLIGVLVLCAVLLMVAQSSAIAPFIYSLF
jgi:hypothetical protein